MAARERETEFWGFQNPTPNIVPNPVTGQFEPLQPMAGMNQIAFLPFGQIGHAPDPVRMLVPSKHHYDKLVGPAAMNPQYQSLPVSPHFQRVHDPRNRLPAGWEEWIDVRELPGATPIVYWDSVTRISTYDGPEVHGERAWVGVFGPAQPPLLPAVGTRMYWWGKLPPTQGPPYGQGQHLDPSKAGFSITPQLLANHAPSANLQQPAHPIPGSWINPKTAEKDGAQRTAITHAPAHEVPVNGVKRKKDVLLDKEGTKLVEATDYLGKKEVRVARPPANRAASRYVGFAFNEGSVNTASANTHEERVDTERTPRPSDFKQKKVEGVRINVPEPTHVVPAVVAQGYKPALQQEIFDRLFALMTHICNTQKHLLPNESAQLAVQSLKAEIEGYLRDPLKQGKEERQRNLDLIKTLEFSEAKKFTDQYKSAQLPDGLDERVARPDTHQERIIKAQQEKQVKQTKQKQQPMGAFSYAKPKDDKKAALKNLKHAQPGDLYHLRDTPLSSHPHHAQPTQRTSRGDWSSSPIEFYTQENQLPQRDKQPSITSGAGSSMNRGNGIQREPFDTAAPEDDVFGPSQPLPPPPPPPPAPAPAATPHTIGELFGEPAILTLYDARGRVLASRASNKDDSAEAMKAQLVASAKKASRSYTMASTATAVFVGPATDRKVSNVFGKVQPSEEDIKSWEMQPRLTVDGDAPQRRSSALNVGNESRIIDTKLNVPTQPVLRKRPSLLMEGGIADALSVAESFESGTNNAKLTIPKQPSLRKKPSLLFMEGGIADALSAAESIKSEQGLWKPVDQLPMAISDRAHYGGDADDDSFSSTPIQYNRGGGGFGHTTKHSDGVGQTRVVSKGYKVSEDSGGQQTSAPDPDLNNYYEIPGVFGKKSFVNVATGKEFTKRPANGKVVKVPRVAIEGEVITNDAVDTFVAKYTSHIEDYKRKEAERKAQKTKAEADKKKQQEMSFLTANGPPGCGWKAVSDSGHNRHTSTSNNFGNLTRGAIKIPSQTRIPSVRIPSARHTPVFTAHDGYGAGLGPGHQHWGQPSGLHTHHNPYGSNMIYNNPYGPPGAYGQSTQYNRFGTQQQQWGYQGQFNGPYGNGYAGGGGFGQGTFYHGGHQTTHNAGYGGGTPAYGPGGPFHNQGLAPPPNCTIHLDRNNSRIFSNPFQ